ncbi:hypothetical protein DMA15_12465 [Streptomyces sp. WAC 01529]|uniref:hypothetical protein n=1 Tax=Streptomyces sp. WAC 01529 TaxID=2203205 RepID=UPI000F71D277|nr:hypothetical protein [Streptomyces sp. WAC 01529]AZM53301.1 hypothetical protein DMA15_12465 [Streptomyces sp. WAC 01529]
MTAADWHELLGALGYGVVAGLLLILAGAVDTARRRNSRSGKDTSAMPERHNPKSCPQCTQQSAELRHPMYRRAHRLVFLPGQRGGAA